MMKVSEIIDDYRKGLSELYSAGELSQVTFMVFEYVLNFSKTDLVMKRDKILSVEQENEFARILSELKKNKPVQYVLGHAWFYGMKFIVNEHVLIPRQETEELVDWIIRDEGRRVGDDFRIIDVCTGSGCIAVSLKANLPGSEIFALDVSADAIKVASKNASLNKMNIHFIQNDILLPFPDSPIPRFEIIVSNPPYVLHTDKEDMTERVLNYEPHLALFAKDDDPLIFYKGISEFALLHLKPGGKLYFEINELKGKEVVELLVSKGFSDVVLKKDMNGKDRMVRAILA
jgi:release factor glutamine methyltransferase